MEVASEQWTEREKELAEFEMEMYGPVYKASQVGFNGSFRRYPESNISGISVIYCRRKGCGWQFL